MEMEATDQATSSRLRPRQTDKEILSEFDGSSKEDEDFLAGLNPEEKECLEYFLQTISALDEDISEEVGEGCHEEMAGSVGSEDQSKSSLDPSMQRPTSLEAAPATPVPSSAASRSKTIRSLSQDVGDSSLRSRSNSDDIKPGESYRSRNSHPIRLRKFDTIVRSGVNVQELRSRFLLHLDSSASVEREPREGGARTMNQLGPLTGIQKTPKNEALQKLGLLQRNSSAPNMKIPLVPMTGQQDQISLGGSLGPERNAGSINTPEEPL
nr:uncharacterized protein LOC110079944 isoform X1 [Pogona vitticeps]XP_020651097.1 uncharacterized protein LOC110079944 isoform X1 [Pogona vitticeps]XP_020651099.1 uncharacterized protein LOC110079944 isoform X1 [Pogona vitticeps]XP_020651100.1 uncharacterized protein LOC110079944 isoform X1 [Pogona vitticeps]